MNNQPMILKQSPVIEHKLIELGTRVSEKLAALNIDNQVATEETIQALKTIRADLNKEAKEYEEQRKKIKEAVLNPYSEFESIYKAQISQKYKEADTVLKNKINDFEIKVKQAKKEKIVAYFEELRTLEKLDWLSFDRLNIEINLSTSEKKYKEQILAIIKQVVDDLELISTDTHSAEMLVEYKKTLNASASIKTVRDRKQKEKEEKERILSERTRRRTSYLRSLGFISHDITRTYNWIKDESVMISFADLESLTDEDWNKRYNEIEAKIKALEESKAQPLQAPTIAPPIQPTITVPEAKEEIFEAKFLVSGTYKELKALGDFLKSNNYKYQNID